MFYISLYDFSSSITRTTWHYNVKYCVNICYKIIPKKTSILYKYETEKYLLLYYKKKKKIENKLL